MASLYDRHIFTFDKWNKLFPQKWCGDSAEGKCWIGSEKRECYVRCEPLIYSSYFHAHTHLSIVRPTHLEFLSTRSWFCESALNKFSFEPIVWECNTYYAMVKHLTKNSQNTIEKKARDENGKRKEKCRSPSFRYKTRMCLHFFFTENRIPWDCQTCIHTQE